MSNLSAGEMPPFYNNVVPLSSDRHRAWSIEQVKDYRFTEKASLVYLSCVEFRKASRSFPIVFVGSETQVFPVALLGVSESENLFVRKDGKWDADYIPAYVRRYPFVAANMNEKNDTLLLSVDESYPGFNSEGKGKRLYTEQGEQSDYIKEVSTFVGHFQAEYMRTRRFCEHLLSNELLEPMTVRVTLEGRQPVVLKGFYAVSYAKLKKLASEKLTKMMQDDELGLVFSHLSSLDRFEALVARSK